MRNLINRLSNPKSGTALLFCLVLVSALLAMPLRQMYTKAQENEPGKTRQTQELPYLYASARVDAQEDEEHGKSEQSEVEPSGNDLITAATYAFSTQAGVALEDMSSGTTQLVPAGSDDGNSTLQNIGFEFWYDGVRFTSFGANANGLVRLGAAVGGASFTNNLATTTESPKIAAYWEDLCVGTNGQVHYKVTGSTPDRKLVVEWQNMQVTRGAGCSGPGGGTLQMWLFESAATANPGAIQFVYGNGIVASATADGGASIGLQSGAATNFASVTAATDTVSYTTANNTNTAGIAVGKSYVFTPNIPLAPTGLTFTPVTALSIQLNWTDNATNEFGYAIYRSTDGTNYSFLTQTPANAASFNDTGLIPGTTYFYRVAAVTEGVISSFISGSQATAAPGNDACAGSGGDWDNVATWADGSVPTAADNVTVGTGCTVTVNVANAVALNLTVNSGGTLQSPLSGTVTNNNLTVGGNVTNNGTLDFSTNGDASGAILTFGTTFPNVTFGGSGATTDVRAITVAKGSLSSTVELNTTNFTVQGVNTDVAGFLTLTSGTFKISGTFTAANRVFTTAAYTIPATGGFWLDNPNFTVAGQNGSPTNNGLLRVSDGTFNVGTMSGNSMGGGTGAQFIVEGGTSNYAGRLQTTSVVSYTQSGGMVNVCTVGNAAATACFGLTGATNTFDLSGGTIVLVLPSTNATPLDYSVSTTSTFLANPAGTTLQLGTGGAAETFRVVGNTPNILIPANKTMAVGSGTAGAAIFHRGSAVTNNGAIVVQGTGASSRFDWAASGPMSYGGTGTFGTAGTSFVGVGMSANGGDTTLNAPIFINRVNFFAGGFVNSNQITLGNGSASTTVIQVGNSTTPTNAGVFDVSPNYNSGTGGHIVLHLRSTTLNRTTGFEINPLRTLTQLTVDNDAAGATLNMAGGNLTISGAGAGSLALTNGMVVTGANTLFHNAGTVTRTTGRVNGNLSRNFTATGAYTYHVGTANGYSPVAANVTAGTFPQPLTVAAVQGPQPNLPTPSLALSRYWRLTGANLTSDLTFNYLDPTDIPGTATEANFAILKYDGALSFPGGTVNTTANTATITGVTSFSDWTLAETGATMSPGTIQMAVPTASFNEDAGAVSLVATRTGGSDGAVSADYGFLPVTANGGASCDAGIDFAAVSGTLNWADGDSAPKNIPVTICEDALVESDEQFTVALTGTTGGATIGTPGSTDVTIIDNDVVSGPVTVTATAGTASGTYANLTAAIAAVNDGTHQGDIAININENLTEPGTVVLNSSGAGSALYTSVSIHPTADGLTVSGVSAQGRGLIELNGADNVTIDGDNPNSAGTNRDLTLQNTAANTVTFTSVIRVALNTTTVNSADNNIFRNLNIVGSSTGRNISTATGTGTSENTTFGVFVGPNASGATTAPTAITSVLTGVAAGATATNLTVNNNSVVTAARAVSINGSATSVLPGLQVRNNSIGNPVAGDVNQVTAIGITVQGSTDAVIADNTVYVEGFVASSAAGHAINVGVNSTAVTSATIEKNKVNRAQNNNPATWAAYGINLGGGNSHIVKNNFVSNVINNQVAGTGAFGTTFGAYGIRVASGTGHQIYHNSVHLYGPLPGTVSTNLTAALLIVATGQTGVDVRNNIFSNQVVGGNPAGTRNTCVFLPSGATAAMNLTWNNNIYFQGTDALNAMAQVGTAFATGAYMAADFNPATTTPAANFRSYSSTLSAAGTNDNASATFNPQFISDTDLHILPTSQAESAGVDVGVTSDIDGDVRGTVPDIGADEISVAGPGIIQFNSTNYSTNEGTTATISVIRSAGLDGTVGATATITDGTATGGASCTAGVDYINPGPQTLAFNSGEALKTFTIETCSDATLKSNETVIMTLANPTGGATIGTNNPATLTIVDVPPPFVGTVNVGAGEIFTSLTNAGGIFQSINEAGLSGDLTVNITSDLTAETGSVVLNQFAEFGVGGYTLTIKPSGGARVISGTSAINTGLISLNGADRVTFDGSLSGGTDRSLTVTNNQTGTSTVFWIRSASASNGANNNTIKNCIINGTSTGTAQTTAGILAGSGTTIGGPAEAPNNNNTVANNWIYKVQNSLYNQGNAGFDQNWTVTGNEFGSSTPGDKNAFRGMLMGNATNFVISGNTVHGVSSFPTTTAAMSGIQLAFGVSNGSVTGNRIYDIVNVSSTGTGAFGMQLSAVPVSNVIVANNMLSEMNAVGSATVASNGHGININAATALGAGAYGIYFNTINNSTNQASGTTAGLHIASTVGTAGALNVRNNIFANTQTSGATRYAVYSAAGVGVFSTINYNDYFSSQNVGFIGAVRTTLADWQTATGQDANSLAVDPLFVSATDLHLQAGSPMINAGTPIAGITTDIDGDTRSATTPAIGADEVAGPATGPDISVTKVESADPVTAGSNLTYTVTATNNGPGTPVTMTLQDVLPANANVTFVSVTGGTPTTPDPAPGSSGGTINHSFPGVAPGNSVVMTVVVATNAATPHGTIITNTATAGSSGELGPDPNTDNNTIAITTTINAPSAVPSLVIVKLENASGRPVANSWVTLTEQNGTTHVAKSNSFGYASYFNILSQQNVTISVQDKRFTFTPFSGTINGDTAVTMTANP